MDLTSRLRSIVRSGPGKAPRELTYEPDDGYRNAAVVDRELVASALGGRHVATPFGECLVIDRRYESDRWHGDIRVGDCALEDFETLRVLDPALGSPEGAAGDRSQGSERAGLLRSNTNACGSALADACGPALREASGPALAEACGSTLAEACGSACPEACGSARREACGSALREGGGSALHGLTPRAIFIDLETTGLSGGAGTVAFLVGCGYFDLGAFQVRQFLLTSHSGERALLAAVADFFEGADLIVTYNGKTFDVPVMETRWLFHRMEMPLESVPHFDMLHPARRLWRHDEQGCRLSTLERLLFDVRRVGDVPGLEIPSRFFRFVRSGDPRPLEPVLEHNRIDLVSLAAVTARAMRLARDGHDACRSSAEALALGKVFERAGHHDRAEACYRRAAESPDAATRADALYRCAVRLRRNRRFADAASMWRELIAFTEPRTRRRGVAGELRQVAIEALAIHQEHRAKDLAGARELALSALEESDAAAQRAVRHRLARLDRKLYKNKDAQLFSS